MGSGGPSVLLVDDDHAVRRAYVRALRAFAPMVADDGVHAQQILSEVHVDVVVCDLEMPRLSGLDLMRWAHEHCPHPVWIVVSGRSTLDAAIQALKLGAFDFICKPMHSPLQLHTCVSNAVRHQGLVAEVAARRATEAGLRESDRQIRDLVENLPDLAWSARPDGYVDFYNHCWYRYTGSTFETMQGWGWESVHSPELLGAVLARWRHSLTTGEPFEMEYSLRRADGVFRWFLSRVRPLRGADSHIERWFGTNTDIDDARRASAQREQLVVDLRDALAARDEFISIASHELRTPLTVLQLQLQGTAHLVERLNGEQSAKFVGKLEVATRQTTHLIALVDGLLDVARSGYGHPRLERQDVDLVAIARDAIARCHANAARAGCSIALDAAPAEIIGLWDRARLVQVVTNVITNSIKYGLGRPISVRVTSADGWARLVVRDHGIGIAPQDLARVFSRFERAVSSRHYGGLGLGLYIARQIVEAHGGTIDVASELGQGSAFTVSIRLRPEPAGCRDHPLVEQARA